MFKIFGIFWIFGIILRFEIFRIFLDFKVTLVIWQYLSIYDNIYQYLTISINIYQYLSISINIWQYLTISINVQQCLLTNISRWNNSRADWSQTDRQTWASPRGAFAPKNIWQNLNHIWQYLTISINI